MPRTDPPPSKNHDAPPSGTIGRPSQIPRLSNAPLASDESTQRERDKDVLDDLEITVGETEITLSEAELGESHLATGWADETDASEHDRVTVAPPMPEQEYVAKMMKELPEQERVPPSRAITPPRGLSKPPLGADSAAPARASRRPSGRPKKKDRETGASVKPRRASRAPGPAPATLAPSPSKAAPSPVTPSTSAPVAPQSEPLTLDLSDSLLPIAVNSPIPVPPFDRARVPKFDLSDSAPAPSPRPRITLPSNNQSSALDAVSTGAGLPSSGPPRFSFGPASGDPLELVGVRAQSVRPGPPPKATMIEVRDRFDVGDFSGALTLAAKILEDEPEHVDALLYAEHCRDVLKQMYISNLGGLRRVPQIAVSPEQLRWLALDHRAGFLLSQLDGRSTFEELLDVCGMPPFEAIRLLVQLLQQNVIRVV
jgi:hypothetical protein